MNDAHLHLVVNHFPIIGTMLGLVVLLFGVFLKNNSIKNTGFFLLILAAFFALASMATGDGAEEMVEDMPSIGKQIIHDHEEIAEKFTLVLYATGLFSIFSLLAAYKKKSYSSILTYITVALAFIAAILSTSVGTSGGEIRHTEIRKEYKSSPEEAMQTKQENTDESVKTKSED